MRRRTLLKLSNEGISASKAVACDICLYNKTNNKLIIVETAKFSKTNYPSTDYSPVGVVVIPGSHDVYGDGSCGVMSIKPMSCDTPTTGGTSEEKMYWGPYEIDISTLPNLNQVPYVGIGSDVGDSASTVVGQSEDAYLPSDKFSAMQCPHDNDVYYYNQTVSGSYINCSPSPFLSDDSRNPAYYQTSSPSSTSNCLADFDGVGNTDKIISQRGTKDYSSWKPTYSRQTDYPAASCCDMYYTEGTKQGDWYLPAMGELGYIMPNFNKINTTINTLKNVYIVGVQLGTINYYWSSTEYDTNSARSVRTGNGCLYNYSKDNYFYARAFLRVK